MTRREAPVTPPVVLSIAGSDSGGGAGIQADLKTIEACGGFGTTAITSVTAQNTRGVEGVHLLPIDDVEAQIEAVRSDLDVAAVKTGMLATSEVVDLVAEYAPDLPNLVVDPVMVAASGDRLLDRDAEDAYADLVAHATLVTPNTDEAEVLTGVAVEDEESAVRAGTILVEEFGARAALIKGGHVPGDVVGDVLVTDEDATVDTGNATTTTTISHERVDTDATHGSGCTLSSAIATHLAHGADLTSAVTAGIDLLARAVRYNLDVGRGPGAVHHLVALRDDAALGETVEALETGRERFVAPAFEPLASATGDALAGVTPYADAPDSTVTVALSLGGGGETADSEPAGTLAVGIDDPLARALLAAREAEPGLRYVLSCRFDDAVASALRSLSWATAADVEGTPGTGRAAEEVPADDDVLARDDDALARAVTRAFASADAPRAVGASGTLDEPITVLFGASIDALADRARLLAEAVDDAS